MKEMLLMAAKSIPEEQINSVKSGLMKTLHQLAFAQKMSIKLIDDEEDVALMWVYTETDEIIVCPVTLSYKNGQTRHCRELTEDGFSLTKFIEHLVVKELIKAMSESNDVKQLQMVIDALKSAKEKSQITQIEQEDAQESPIETEPESEPKSETESGIADE